MGESTKGTGLTIKCRARVSINGKMGESTREIIYMIKSMALGYISGRMEGYMKESGLKASSTGMESTIIRMAILNLESGRMVRESNGLRKSRKAGRSDYFQVSIKS